MKSFLKIVLLTATLALTHTALGAQTILVFGDSLSAGYGIARDDSWVNLLQQSLKKSHPQTMVVNASISGETTSGGVRRLGKALQEHRPAVVILELGANDGLRGTPLVETEKSLNQMIQQAKKAHAKVMLLGMQIPPNYGQDYANKFGALYLKMKQKHKDRKSVV
jgi:acyl-CoA thioesterase-1